MLKKLLVTFILFLGFISIGFSQCNFNSQDTEVCERYYLGFEKIFLEDLNDFDYSNSSLEIFQNDISRFEYLSIEDSDEVFSLENSLSHSGVYTLTGNRFDELGNLIARGDEEIIIDLYQPLPPKIDLILESSIIRGSVDHGGDFVYAYDVNGNVLSFVASDSEGHFTMDLGINSPSYVLFKSKSQNNLESEGVSRYVYTSNRGEYFFNEVQTASLDLPTIFSVNSVVSGKTYERNFFVSGTSSAQDGSILFINGQRVQVIEGSFGIFIELNTGINQIEVKSKSGILKDSFSIEYVVDLFFFEELSIQKVFENSFSISGKTTIPKSFLLFMNGEFISEVEVQAGNYFDFSASNVEGDRVFLELYGEDNSYESIILYKDLEEPIVSSYNFNSLHHTSTLLFEIKDDVGVDYSSISLVLNDEIELDYSKRFGEFITFDILNLTQGFYSYQLVGLDLYGRNLIGDITGSFSISDEDLTFGVYSDMEGVEIFGSTIFSNKPEISLYLETTGPIGFKHMYIDGVDHVDYSIENSNLVLINNFALNNNNNNGEIEFIYVDGEGVEYVKNMNYIFDDKKAEIILDSISHYAKTGVDSTDSYVRVSGKVVDSLYDWNSFFVNSKHPMFTSNSYFEALVTSDEIDLLLSGSDILGNGFLRSRMSSLFEQDNLNPSILIRDSINTFSGDLLGTFNGNEEIISIENSDFKRSHFEKQFNLSSEQREGIQYVEFSGRNQFSQKQYSLFDVLTLDNTNPYVIISQEDTFFLIDINPTFSGIVSSTLTQNNILVPYSSCESQFFNGKCLKVTVGSYDLVVIDEYENELRKSISLDDISQKLVLFNSIYFHGTDTIVTQKDVVIQGSITSTESVEKVILNDDILCDFDGVNFVCMGEALFGENIFSVKLLSGNLNVIFEDTIPIVRSFDVSQNLNVDFTSGVYEFGNRHYYFGEEIFSKISIDEDSILSYYVNGQKTINGKLTDGDTNFNLYLSPYVEGRDFALIDVGFKVENDENREVSFFTLFYDRSKELILNILIN